MLFIDLFVRIYDFLLDRKNRTNYLLFDSACTRKRVSQLLNERNTHLCGLKQFERIIIRLFVSDRKHYELIKNGASNEKCFLIDIYANNQ